jgi:hypothetical protein
MRTLCLLFLLVVGAAIAVFVWQNEGQLTVTFFNQAIIAPVAGVLGVAYGLGMLTGWSFVGLLRRSFARATDFREPAQVR